MLNVHQSLFTSTLSSALALHWYLQQADLIVVEQSKNKQRGTGDPFNPSEWAGGYHSIILLFWCTFKMLCSDYRREYIACTMEYGVVISLKGFQVIIKLGINIINILWKKSSNYWLAAFSRPCSRTERHIDKQKSQSDIKKDTRIQKRKQILLKS